MAITKGAILFDQDGTRKYHTGVSALALYVRLATGDTAPNRAKYTPSGAEAPTQCA